VTRLSANASLRERATLAAYRLSRAIDLYWELSDPFAEGNQHTRILQSVYRRWTPPSPRPTLADIAVDVSTCVESLIYALRDERGLRADRNRPIDLLRIALMEPEVDGALQNDAERLTASFKHIRDIRNNRLHGSVQSTDKRAGESLRDTIELGLRLTATFPLLRESWNTTPWRDIDKALWEFVGQPDFLAAQVRRIFSGCQFSGLRGRLNVRRHGDGGHFSIGGPFTVAGDVEQSRWNFGGATTGMLEFPDTHAEVGIISPPLSSQESESGEDVVEGELELVARDLPLHFDGFSDPDNPLLEPIYLSEGENSPWTQGPGYVELVSLKLTIPFRARTIWYATPESRLHIRSEFLSCDATGTASGELRFFLPGHAGRPALKGRAFIGGHVSAAKLGDQVSEWQLFGSENEQPRRGRMWKGVSRLAFWADLSLHISFVRF
jgi:hypothetical protein